MEVDVDAGGVAEGDFEGNVGRCGFGSQVDGFKTRTYVCGSCLYEAEGCHRSCDGGVVLGVDEDVYITEGTGGRIGVEVGDEGPAFEYNETQIVLFEIFE